MALDGNPEENTEVMKEWSVELQALTPAPVEELAERLIDYFADRGPAVSLERDRVEVRLDIAADSPNDAFQEALTLLSKGFPELYVVRAQVDAVEDLERRLEQSNAPELLGLAEVAEELGVSKQRVSELARPSPRRSPGSSRVRCGSAPLWSVSCGRGSERRAGPHGRSVRQLRSADGLSQSRPAGQQRWHGRRRATLDRSPRPRLSLGPIWHHSVPTAGDITSTSLPSGSST
jgi:hypothetical protein